MEEIMVNEGLGELMVRIASSLEKHWKILPLLRCRFSGELDCNFAVMGSK
jgi:hypothetical protein